MNAITTTTTTAKSFQSVAEHPPEHEHPDEVVPGIKLQLRQSGLSICQEGNPAMGGRRDNITMARSGVDIGRALKEVGQVVKASLVPASRGQIARWMTVLRSITAHRDMADLDENVMIHTWLNRLSAFPPDVVAHVLLKLRWQWWPTLAEVEEVCERHTRPRQLLERQLFRACAVRWEVPPRKIATPEARRWIMAEVFGAEKTSSIDTEEVTHPERLPIPRSSR